MQLASVFNFNKQKTAPVDTELAAAHHRINLMNERMANIEHLLGIRRHDHTKIDLRWRFGQLRESFASGEPLKEIPTAHRPLRHAA